jgi:hypothetical protein
MIDLRRNYPKVAATLIACSANGFGLLQLIVSISDKS